METRKYAIYSRKSKFTGTGESTTNQIELCKKVLKERIPDIKDEDILIYEDEGYSGYNINRPKFKSLIDDIKNNKIKILIFYKLDRISRNVKDFAKLMNLFDTHNLTFISATENIETITPSGKAMTYMISVFAELERNTIAERIKDNMLSMAKSGVWLGGCTPTGYKSKEGVLKRNDEKIIKYYYLTQDKDIKKVKLIFSKFLELKSLTKLETYLMNNNIYSKNNLPYTRFSLKNILTNPVYVIADKLILSHYQSLNAQVFSKKDFKGENLGLMVYNKTKNINHKMIKKKDMKDWIVAVGKHKGIIISTDFLKVERILNNNKNMRYRKMNNSPALLSGLLKCPNCNTTMRPKIRSNKKNGLIYDYICEKKEKSKGMLCNKKNINGCTLDAELLSHIANLDIDTHILSKMLKERSKSLKKTNLDDLINEKNKNIKTINDLIDKIKYLDVSIIPRINKEIDNLEKQNKELDASISKLKLNKKITLDYIIKKYKSYIEKMDTKTKKYYINLIIKKIEVDKDTITITYN